LNQGKVELKSWSSLSINSVIKWQYNFEEETRIEDHTICRRSSTFSQFCSQLSKPRHKWKEDWEVETGVKEWMKHFWWEPDIAILIS
jgi:hypothetical protein